MSLTGGVTLVAQNASDDRIRSEVVGSLDLFLDVGLGPVAVHAYVEGNTTPRDGGVSSLVARANTDAGSALDAEGRGRVQVSELRLVVPVAGDLRAHAGILDATGFLDVSRIANDENLFFLGLPFVNNPTIQFPDYAPGVALEGSVTSGVPARIGVVLSSSDGLADHPRASYGQLLDLGAEGKGLFGGVALRWVGVGRRLSLGGWLRTDEAPRLSDAGTASNRGLFTVLGWSRGDHSVSARFGLANGSVAETRGFAGLTYLWSRRPDAIGVAVGQSIRSDAGPSPDDIVQGEAFLRRRLAGQVFVTVSLQRIQNAPLTGSSLPPLDLWVSGVRLSMQF